MAVEIAAYSVNASGGGSCSESQRHDESCENGVPSTASHHKQARERRRRDLCARARARGAHACSDTRKCARESEIYGPGARGQAWLKIVNTDYSTVPYYCTGTGSSLNRMRATRRCAQRRHEVRGARIIRERRDAVRIPRAARVFLQYKRDLILYKLDCGPYGSCQEKGSIPYVVDGADDSSCTRLVRVNQLVRVRTRSCVH